MRHLVGSIFFGAMVSLHADTVLKWYRPFGEPVNQQKPEIKHQVQGGCHHQSQRILREDALRCEAKGQVYDPCFVRTWNNKTQVLCVPSPWVSEATELLPVEAMNTGGLQPLDMSKTYPWALELVDGSHCHAVDPGRFYDAMPIRYECDDRRELVGYLQRCNTTWRILAHSSRGTSQVDVARAWF